jgi:hypothetical protein
MLEAEQRMNSNNIGLILQDGLTNRQEFCDIVNSIWGLGIWVEVSETVSNIDKNMDGVLQDGIQPSTAPVPATPSAAEKEVSE